MNNAMQCYERAALLLETGRYVEAEKELRACLRDLPEFPLAFSLLAIALSNGSKSKKEEAVRIAEQGVALEPEEPFCHYGLAISQLSLDRFDEAEKAIRKSIELDMWDAQFQYILGVIYLQQNKLQRAKEVLLEGLAIDPEHEPSLTMIAQIESRIGDSGVANEIAERAVKNSPESSMAHASRGYSYVYGNRPKEAFDAFREALRLDPNNEMARSGMLVSLKMHHFFYRNFFMLTSKLNRLSGSMQWALIIGMLIGYNVLFKLMKSNPGLTPIIAPIIILYLLFCLFSWVVDPITYSLLWFSKWGRLAMTPKEKCIGIVFVSCIAIGAGGVVSGLLIDSSLLVAIGIGVLLATIPLSSSIIADDKRKRTVYAAYSALIFIMAFGGFIMQNNAVFIGAFWAFFLFPLLSNFFSIRESAPRS